ncbi:hypothetical protein NOCA2140033 [metagenome]|uniref:Uncharacterized protein n=1 Tax=metagenome TaxID=256318 RepID=A0A2P2BWV6_9ZZZZ
MPISAMSVQFVTRSLADVGIPLPKAAQEAADVLQVLQDEAIRDVVTEVITNATATPLTVKNASKRVQELAIALTARERAAEAARAYERPVLDQFRDAIASNVDELIVEMRPIFDQCAAIFHNAGATLEPGRQVNASDGVEAVRTYLALDDAQQRFAAINSARLRITEMAGSADSDVTWYVESVPDMDALMSARSLWKRGPHYLTRAGYRLRLNTRAEAQAVADSAANGTAAALKAQQQARVAAARDPLREAAYAQVLGQ